MVEFTCPSASKSVSDEELHFIESDFPLESSLGIEADIKNSSLTALGVFHRVIKKITILFPVPPGHVEPSPTPLSSESHHCTHCLPKQEVFARIMHQHAGIADVEDMFPLDFDVVNRLTVFSTGERFNAAGCVMDEEQVFADSQLSGGYKLLTIFAPERMRRRRADYLG